MNSCSNSEDFPLFPAALDILTTTSAVRSGNAWRNQGYKNGNLRTTQVKKNKANAEPITVDSLSVVEFMTEILSAFSIPVALTSNQAALRLVRQIKSKDDLALALGVNNGKSGIQRKRVEQFTKESFETAIGGDLSIVAKIIENVRLGKRLKDTVPRLDQIELKKYSVPDFVYKNSKYVDHPRFQTVDACLVALRALVKCVLGVLEPKLMPISAEEKKKGASTVWRDHLKAWYRVVGMLLRYECKWTHMNRRQRVNMRSAIGTIILLTEPNPSQNQMNPYTSCLMPGADIARQAFHLIYANKTPESLPAASKEAYQSFHSATRKLNLQLRDPDLCALSGKATFKSRRVFLESLMSNFRLMSAKEPTPLSETMPYYNNLLSKLTTLDFHPIGDETMKKFILAHKDVGDAIFLASCGAVETLKMYDQISKSKGGKPVNPYFYDTIGLALLATVAESSIKNQVNKEVVFDRQAPFIVISKQKLKDFNKKAALERKRQRKKPVQMKKTEEFLNDFYMKKEKDSEISKLLIDNAKQHELANNKRNKKLKNSELLKMEASNNELLYSIAKQGYTRENDAQEKKKMELKGKLQMQEELDAAEVE